MRVVVDNGISKYLIRNTAAVPRARTSTSGTITFFLDCGLVFFPTLMHILCRRHFLKMCINLLIVTSSDENGGPVEIFSATPWLVSGLASMFMAITHILRKFHFLVLHSLRSEVSLTEPPLCRFYLIMEEPHRLTPTLGFLRAKI